MQSNEKLHNSRARDLFKHQWQPSNQNYCIELRKKKRTDVVKDKRSSSMILLNPNLDPLILQSFENDLICLSDICEKDAKSLLERMKKCVDDVRLISSEWLLGIFDRVIMILNQGDSDLAGSVVEVLCGICKKVERFDEDAGNMICDRIVEGLQVERFIGSIGNFCEFFRVLFGEIEIKDVDGFLGYLSKVERGGTAGGDECVVKILLALSKNNQICRVLPNDLFKLIINGLVSLRDELQLDSVLVLANFSCETDGSRHYLIEIGILSILSHLLDSSPLPIKTQTCRVLSNLLKIEDPPSICLSQLLSPYLSQSILSQVCQNPPLLSQSLIKLLYHQSEKSIIFNTEILDSLISQNIFSVLCQHIQDSPEYLNMHFLNLIDNLLYLSRNSFQTQSFIDSGCYFALELYSSQSKSQFSSQVKYILSSYFES